jgi:hypothetical protein
MFCKITVYAIIIALVIPDTRVFESQPTRLNANATISSRFEWIFSAYVLNKNLKIKGKTFLWSKCSTTNCRFLKT